jgi:hypothetical protein
MDPAQLRLAADIVEFGLVFECYSVNENGFETVESAAHVGDAAGADYLVRAIGAGHLVRLVDRPTHQRLVADLVKSGEVLLSEFTPDDVHLLRVASRILVASSDIADAVKRLTIYREKTFNWEKVKFSVELIREHLGWLDDIVYDFQRRANVDVASADSSIATKVLNHVLGMTDPEQLLANMKPHHAAMLHMVLALVADSGELLDQFAGWIFDQRPLDKDNAIEELGDLSFFEEAICQFLGVSAAAVRQSNISKLLVRFKKGHYSNEAAIARADKNSNI